MRRTMDDLISVIVPVYNVDAYLDRCVHSIINQTYQNLEIILIDDGSTDTCPQLCDEWGKKDNRIKVIHKNNGGLSDARNAGLTVANGVLIGFVDSDDWVAPEMYERLKNAIDKNKSDISACSVKMVWESTAIEKMLTVQENCVLGQHEAQKELLNENKLKHPVWYKLYKRSVIKDILFDKGKYHEDVYWSYQIIGNAANVSIIDYIGYFYWQRANSIMGNNYSLKRLDVIEAVCRRYEYFKNEFPELSKQAKLSIWNNCIYHSQLVISNLSPAEQKTALGYLESVKKRYPLKYSEYRDQKYTHQIWLLLASVSLKTAATIKNALKVGL